MKNKLKKISFLTVIFLILTLLLSGIIFAKGSTAKLEPVEYSDEYKAWLELSEEERKETIMPKMYIAEDIGVETTNPLKLTSMQKASLTTRYLLADVIPENVVIKNQGYTGSCWTFGSNGVLESSLGLRDYYNGFVTRTYDFSERHMEYATSRTFKNSVVNKIRI